MEGFTSAARASHMQARVVVGYAISWAIDARLVVAALNATSVSRRTPRGCICQTDRVAQYASARYRELLAHHGLIGSMSRRGNPYDKQADQSLTQTLRVSQ